MKYLSRPSGDVMLTLYIPSNLNIDKFIDKFWSKFGDSLPLGCDTYTDGPDESKDWAISFDIDTAISEELGKEIIEWANKYEVHHG